jgi:ribonuclease III
MPLMKLQQKMGVEFKNPQFLELALTHTSYVHEHRMKISESNERLEFLGDAVLNFCIAEMLVKAFPEEPEGVLSKRRAALVNQKQLARLSELIEVGSALKLGKGEEKTGGRTKESLLGDAFEAVVGALYLDQGLMAVKKYLSQVFSELIPQSKSVETSRDYKTRLQEYHQQLFKKSPRYFLESESGPDHSKTFEVRIEFQGKVLGRGKGKSKREAEQEAARKAFEDLKMTDQPRPKRPRVKKKKPVTETKPEGGESEKA